MFLSRVIIDRRNRQKMQELNHVGAFHNWIENCFPEEHTHNIRSRKLWRIDSLQNKDYLLLVSPNKPALEKLEAYGIPGSGESKDYRPFLSQLDDKTKAYFRVTLNPVVSIKDGSRDRGRVVPHVTLEQQMIFLLERAEKNGFLLEENDFSIVDRGYVTLRKPKQKAIQLVKATYEGRLTISDVDLFRQTLTQGIGRQKAYGFGLLTIIPE